MVSVERRLCVVLWEGWGGVRGTCNGGGSSGGGNVMIN